MWGALLRGLSYAPTVGRGAINFIKNHKLGTALTGIFGLGGLSLLTPDKKPDEGNQQPTNQQTQSDNQQQQTSNQQQKQQKDSSKSGSVGVNLPPLESLKFKDIANTQSNEGSDNGSLSQITNQMQSLFLDLEKHRQMYDALSQQYLQANEIYEKQLLQTMQVVPLLLAKTPLNSMTNEDLIQHMNLLFTSMPYEDALEKVSNITKGYYLAKANGVDPSSLSTTDLVMIAENPVLAKSVNENLAQFLEQMGEILKYKIKSNMDKVGALKDQYQNMLKELEEKGKLYKSLIDAYKFEMKQEFDWDKFLQNMAYKNRSLAEREYYHQKSLELREKGMEAKEQKQNAKKDSGIGGSLKPNNEN
jgi:hypothetical protein